MTRRIRFVGYPRAGRMATAAMLIVMGNVWFLGLGRANSPLSSRRLRSRQLRFPLLLPFAPVVPPLLGSLPLEIGPLKSS